MQYLYVTYHRIHLCGGRDPDTFFTHMVGNLYANTHFDHILIHGDFNARIGNLKDTIPEIDQITDRSILDEIKSGHCDSFIEFLKDSNLCLLNGRLSPDRNDYTRVSAQG